MINGYKWTEEIVVDFMKIREDFLDFEGNVFRQKLFSFNSIY